MFVVSCLGFIDIRSVEDTESDVWGRDGIVYVGFIDIRSVEDTERETRSTPDR